MTNKGRTYAEELVGSLDRSGYNKQRNAAQQSYTTNWEALQNQYKNLTDKLKQQQKQANTDFAQGLTEVAGSSFDRMKNANENMVNRGLTTSGINNLVQQADTSQKGEDVLSLLSKAGNTAVQGAEQLSSGNTTLANKENTLNDKIADTLGNIGANETSAQMSYNAGLADIAGDMDNREMNNELAAKQRAASAAASNYNTDEEDAQLEDFYKKMAINEILTNEDLDDRQKANSLAILFEKRNADDIVSGFNKNVKATETYNTEKEKLEKENKKANSGSGNSEVINKINENATAEEKFLNQLLRNGEDKVLDKSGGSQTLMEYLQQANAMEGKGSPTITEEEALKALNKIIGPTGDFTYSGYNTGYGLNSPAIGGNGNGGTISLEDLVNTYNSYKSGETPLLSQQISSGITANKNNAQTNVDNLVKSGITYEDLAKLLYGSK